MLLGGTIWLLLLLLVGIGVVTGLELLCTALLLLLLLLDEEEETKAEDELFKESVAAGLV